MRLIVTIPLLAKNTFRRRCGDVRVLTRLLRPIRRHTLFAVMVLSMTPGLVGAFGLLAGWDQVVICRGDALVTLTIDANGRPIEVTQAAEHSCLPSVDLGSGQDLPDGYSDAEFTVLMAVSSVKGTPGEAEELRPPARAPPA